MNEKGKSMMVGFARSLVALSLAAAFAVGPAIAQEEGGTPHYPVYKPERQSWSFAGPFGTFDAGQLQRGFKVYREVCASCHALELVAFRNLAEPGGPMFTEAEAAQIASEYEIEDGPDEAGDMFMRPGADSDRFPAPFANEQQARASNSGAYPVDLSLIAKARAVERGFPWFLIDIVTQYQELGPDYLHALLTGYQDPPEGYEIPPGQYYNPYFIAGTSLAMAPPLSDGVVTYDDGAPETVDQYSRDVSAFLMWTAEPHMVARKEMGFRVMIFLIVFAAMVYMVKRKIWLKAKSSET